MQITTQTPIINDPILNWLLDRNISYELLQITGITVRDGQIVIPVKDQDGKTIFNKYRRNPFSHEGPKYTYDSGAKSSLFNVHTIAEVRGEPIFITEGELDAVLLNSHKLNAVSSTGGAGTFKEDWVSYFENNDAYICFDRDEAGIRGALRVQALLPQAKIIFLPEMKDGKDVTDYFKTHTLKQFLDLALHAKSWNISKDISIIPEKKSEIDKIMKDLRLEIDTLMEKKREANQVGSETLHIEVLLENLNNRLENWNKVKRNFNKRFLGNGVNHNIESAKAVPITNYLKFNSAGFASCVFHNDDSPSLKLYPDNHVYCFGCSKRGDTIDIVRAIHQCDLPTAVKLILGRT